MRGLNRRHLLAGAAAFFGATLTRSADAQDYPQRAVRVIVPYAPGGASDILARLIQPHLERELGQSFVVDNRGVAQARSARRRSRPPRRTAIRSA